MKARRFPSISWNISLFNSAGGYYHIFKVHASLQFINFRYYLLIPFHVRGEVSANLPLPPLTPSLLKLREVIILVFLLISLNTFK